MEQIRGGLGRAEPESDLLGSFRLNAGFERVNRTIDPNWNRTANRYERPIDLLEEHLGISWVPGKHFEAMDEHLVALARREITSLIITMPPQHGKSTFAARIFPAWYLGENPTHNIISTAYNDGHARESSIITRNTIEEKGDQLGLHLDPLRRGAGSWNVIEGGQMRAVGLQGGITGKPAHFILCDDPIKNPAEAHSQAHKLKSRLNWAAACETRLQANGIRLVIMTRWANDDLAGWLIKEQKEDWTVLHLEAINTKAEGDSCERAKGEALWSQFPVEVLRERRRRVGEYMFLTMYQGKPQKRAPNHDPLISLELLTAAAERNLAAPPPKHGNSKVNVFWQQKPLDLACDVARSGTGDRLTFMGVRGGKLIYSEVKRGQKTTLTANEIIALICKLEPRSIRIDDTGVGGGVTDRVVEIIDTAEEGEDGFSKADLNKLMAVEIIAIQFGSRAYDNKLHANIRTEMWWYLREALRDGKLDIPEDQELFDDLGAPMMGTSGNGRNQLESKEAMKRRGVISPDLGDALAMAIYPMDWFAGSELW